MSERKAKAREFIAADIDEALELMADVSRLLTPARLEIEPVREALAAARTSLSALKHATDDAAKEGLR